MQGQVPSPPLISEVTMTHPAQQVRPPKLLQSFCVCRGDEPVLSFLSVVWLICIKNLFFELLNYQNFFQNLFISIHLCPLISQPCVCVQLIQNYKKRQFNGLLCVCLVNHQSVIVFAFSSSLTLLVCHVIHIVV